MSRLSVGVGGDGRRPPERVRGVPGGLPDRTYLHARYLHARVPRVWCSACGVKQARVPWSEPGSGFTLPPGPNIELDEERPEAISAGLCCCG